MKISWNSLKQIIDLKNINILEVEDKLTLAGFEVEKKINVKKIKDIILEINITPNREDVIGFINIAIELSALFQRPLIINKYLDKSYNNIKIEQLNSSNQIKLFNEFSACIIQNIKIDYIDTNIINYLIAFDIKPTHTILDIISFINLKWGQEIKVYKLPKYNEEISKFTYNINKNKDNKLEIKINNEILIQVRTDSITKNKENSNIILFNYTYENNKDRIEKNKYKNHYYCIYAYKEIFKILSNISEKIKIPNIIYKYNKNINTYASITCKIEKINNILGPLKTKEQKKFLNNETIIKTLTNLSFKAKKINKKIKIHIPDNRQNDIKEDIDIIEEVGRIYGFNNFYDYLPRFNSRNTKTKITSLNKKIRRILRSMGLHEIINYSIKDKENNNRLQIINPLNKEQQNLRENLICNLIISTTQNINQANESFEVFEIGNVFGYDSLIQKYQESLHLSCIFGNNEFNQSTWKDDKSSLTWFQAKGQIEELCEKIQAQVSWSIDNKNNNFTESFNKYLHPKNKIYIRHNSNNIGILSQLNNRINKLICPSHNIYFFEININKLEQTLKIKNQLSYIYLPYSNYPKIARDFSIKINVNISMKEIQTIIDNIKNKKNQIVESIIILNEYYNTNTIKTICLRITYRSKNIYRNKEQDISQVLFLTIYIS